MKDDIQDSVKQVMIVFSILPCSSYFLYSIFSGFQSTKNSREPGNQRALG